VTADLPRSSPEAQGVSSSQVQEFVEAVEKLDSLNSFMLVRHGNVVAEGWWTPYGPQSPHSLYSLSKSFTSTAVGLAIAEGKLKLADLKPPVANAVLRELQRRLSQAMARKVMSSFKAILDEATIHGMATYNAASTVKMRRRDRGEKKVWSGTDFPLKEEMASVIAIITGHWRPVIIVLAFCGLRSSELRGLEWDDVIGLDTAYPQVRVRQRADEEGKLGDTKSDSAQRSVPLNPLAADELRKWKKVCPRDAETGELHFVFPNGNGMVENHANISNRGWKEWQIKAGVSVPQRDNDGKIVKGEDGKPVMKAKYGVHALRHFFASLMIDQGFNPKRVQTLLGHSSIQMTLDVYAHLFPPEKDDDHEHFAKAQASVLMAAK